MHEKIKSRFLISANIFLSFEPGTLPSICYARLSRTENRTSPSYVGIIESQPKGVEPKMSEDLKVSHPRCVVKIQVREENPILYSHKTQLNIKLSLLQQHVSA